MQITAVIFDLNGTILTDEDEYGASFKDVLKSLGRDVQEDYPQVGGIGVKENWPILLEKYNIKTSLTADELAVKTQEAYLKRLGSVTLRNGFAEFAGNLKESGVKVALATSNTWPVVEKVFEEFNLERYFDSVVTREEVLRSKPEPDIFLEAADKLGVISSQCLVIEDAKSGIDAAKKAHMKVIGIARSKEHAISLKGADRVIYSFSELTPEIVSEI